MPRYLGQILASTHLDQQGERLPLQVLNDFCSYAAHRRLPVHQQHDMGRPIVGYMENLRVEPDPTDTGEWRLVGDIYLEKGTYDESWTGFSISAVVQTRQVEDPHISLYLPHPAYNDSTLIADLSNDPNLTIGRWLKKGAESDPWALFATAIAFALKPAWDEIYKKHVAPLVDEFLDRHLDRLKGHGLKIEHVQVVIFAEHEVEVRFKPTPGKERFCFAEPLLRSGFHIVAKSLSDDPRAVSPGVQRYVLVYDDGAREYALVRIEYKDGVVTICP